MVRISPKNECPFSMMETENSLPFERYKEFRSVGPLYWDEPMGAWIVTSYAGCRDVLMRDKVDFEDADADPDNVVGRVMGGRRGIKVLAGEEHAKVHNWLLKAFSARKTATMMDDYAREVVALAVQNLNGKNKAELLSDFVDLIPIRVIAATLQLPWRNELFIKQAQMDLTLLGSFFNRRMAVTEDVSQAATRAMKQLRELLDPILEERRLGMGSDIISQLWRDGDHMVKNWTTEDCFVHVITLFLGGFDTSTQAIGNAIYLLLSDSARASEVRLGGREAVISYAEEVLRLFPPIHYRVRRAVRDTAVLGSEVHRGDFIITLLASANRDAERYRNADEIDSSRKPARDHLTFGVGPRACIGAGLARAEVVEAVEAFVKHFPSACLDPAKPSPSYLGLAMRRFSPVNILL